MGDTAAQKANGLKVALDVIISPKEAFESIRSAPTWGWAIILLTVVFLAGYELQRPATLHASVGTIQHMIATNSFFSSLPDEKKNEMVQQAQHPTAVQAFTGPLTALLSFLLAALLNAVFLLVASSIGGGSGRFASFWAASVNIAVATFGLSSLVLGIICLLRGPDGFNTSGDIVRAIPNVGMIAPSLTGIGGAILASLNIFTLWGLWLNMQVLRWTAAMSGAIVWVVPAILTILGAIVSGWLLSFAG
jgi:hypothetical protein